MKVHDARDGFNDIKPEFFSAEGINWLLVFLIALGAILTWKIFFGKKSKPSLSKRKDLSEYLSELELLQTKLKNDTESPKSIAAQSSLVVRKYITEIFDLSVIECTPKEVDEQLAKIKTLANALSPIVSKLLFQLENISFSKDQINTTSEVVPEKEKCAQLINQSTELLKRLVDHAPKRAV